MLNRRVARAVGVVTLVLTVAACADGEVRVNASAQTEKSAYLTIDVTPETLPAPVAAVGADGGTTLPPGDAGEYQIGLGDIVSVFVFDHPELTVPLAEGERSGGFLVQSDGSFSYPFIGAVKAKDRTVSEIRKDIASRLDKFIPNPQVDVRVVSFNSQRVVIGGEVSSPSTQSITTWPLTVLEAINAAGGLTEEADASRIVVRRSGRSYTVNLEGFLSARPDSSNPILFGGDIVSVPKRRQQEVYVLGEVGSPATIDISEETVSLTQALSRQGGLDKTRASAKGVFVFREVGGQTNVYRIDLASPTGLVLGTRFTLAPNDVVYVTRSPIQRWNDTISRILPTVGAARMGSQ